MDLNTPLEHAKARTESVQEELNIAGAELHLTNTTLEKSLPPQAKEGDVRKALDQNEVVEGKVNRAVEELEQVTELLQKEVEQRRALERQLARR